MQYDEAVQKGDSIPFVCPSCQLLIADNTAQDNSDGDEGRLHSGSPTSSVKTVQPVSVEHDDEPMTE